MIVFASSMLRAEQEGRRRGLCREVRVVGGPRRKQRGMGEEAQRGVKSPKAMVVDDEDEEETGGWTQIACSTRSQLRSRSRCSRCRCVRWLSQPARGVVEMRDQEMALSMVTPWRAE